MRRRFVTLDVFTSQRLAGNPLAVVLDSEGLDTATMQGIAREFNLSETVFVAPPQEPGAGARLRIFTPRSELAFAGHPTIGAAVLLGALHGTGGELVLEEGIGPVRCLATRIDATRGRAHFELPQEPVRGDDVTNLSEIAAALGLTLDDLGCDGFTPSTWSAGNPCTFIPVRGLDAIGRAQVVNAWWETGFPANERPIAYLFCRETVERGHHFHGRMFAPAFGVPEDPATGSAVAAFAGLLAAEGRLADGEHRFAIEQGYEMGRPSVIHLELTLRHGQLYAAAVGGEAVCVMDGTLAL
jgi:trans-2,3-dihydro-3-hydroxyanthranilate isomerase